MSVSASGDYGVVVAAAAGGVNITAQSFTHQSAVMRTAGRAFQPDGTTNWRRTYTYYQYQAGTDWIIPNGAASASYEVRLTNLVWVVKDEGFGISPSAQIGSDATSMTFSGSTITRTGGTSFITQGFTAGSPIRVDRTVSNDGNYTIAAGGVASSVITVDESFTGEGPVATALTQGAIWINSSTVPTGGDSDGDEDVWFDMSMPREWVFADKDATTTTGKQHAQFDFQIRKGTTILATAAMDWLVDSTDGGGPSGGCFMFGTKIRMADNSLKEIQDVEIGDVMKEGGKVKATQIGDASNERWFDIDGVLVTEGHSMCKDGVWVRVEDSGYEEAEGGDRFYVVSNQHHRILAENGHLFADYQEVDYISSGWDDWVIDVLNGNSDTDVLREAIKSTGFESKRAKAYLAREGIYEEDYDDKKNRLLGELVELEERKKESVLARVKPKD